MPGKEMCRVVDNTKKRPEEKQYLICIQGKPGSGVQPDWVIVVGRTAAYEYIKDNIEDIDFETSFILVETCKLSDRQSIYTFMKYVQDGYEDGFDIDEHIVGDWNESDYRINNDIDNFGVEKTDKIDMETLMSGNVAMKDI